MNIDHRFPRPKGNLLPQPTPAENPSECIRYYADKEKLAQGIVEPISEPEKYEMPEGTSWTTPFDLSSEDVEALKTGRDKSMKTKPMKEIPPKEELLAETEEMTNQEIADKHNVSKSLVEKWIRGYGIQRKKGANESELTTETPKEPVVLEVPEPTQPTMEDIEKFFTDVPETEQTETKQEKLNLDFDEVWADVQDDLVVLRNLYIEKAINDFGNKLSELIKAVYGGDEAC